MKDGWDCLAPIVDRRLATLVTILSISVVQAGCRGSTTGTADHLDLVPHLLAEAELRIGDFEDPDIGFSRVAGVDVDDEGNVYILEGLVPEIRVYSPEGTLLRRIGRKGSGPGEFENPPRYGVLGDTVWTVDNLGKRITLFNREGEVLSTGRQEDLMVPLPSGFGWVLPWVMRPDGSFIINVGGRRVWVPGPPPTLPWRLPLSDGYVLVETPLANDGGDAVFTVTRIGLPGDTVYHRVLHYSPSRFTSEDLDSIAVWAVDPDEYEVPWVVRFRISSAG